MSHVVHVLYNTMTGLVSLSLRGDEKYANNLTAEQKKQVLLTELERATKYKTDTGTNLHVMPSNPPIHVAYVNANALTHNPSMKFMQSF